MEAAGEGPGKGLTVEVGGTGKRRGGHAARPCWAGGEKLVLSPPPLFLRRASTEL